MIDLSIKKLKIHVIVNEHNSKKFNELINDLKELNKIPEEFYGDSSYDNENKGII